MSKNSLGICINAEGKTYCPRCKKVTNVFQMSIFNEDMLCVDCLATEKHRPDYEAAKKAEHDAVMAGNYNFPGIGY